MISRFFTWWLILWLFVLLMRKLSDITPQLQQLGVTANTREGTTRKLANSITIIPVTITASRRDYPSVTENRGKGFILVTRHSSLETAYTARHVISDTGYNYFIDWSTPLTSLYYLTWDLWIAEYSWAVDQFAKLTYLTWSDSSEVLVWQYRNNNRNWLTRSIISSDDEWFIINLPVSPGDSGSPVIFSDQTLWVVSQSHSWNQAIVQRIKEFKGWKIILSKLN